MLKQKIRRKIVKMYFSIKGFLSTLKMVKGNKYYASKVNGDCVIAGIYCGKKVFYRTTQALERNYGVVYSDSKKITYPY